MSIDSTSSNPYGAWWTTPDGIQGKRSAFSTDMANSQQIVKDNQEYRKQLNELNQS
ncbi:MAG: hypothetical protein IT584_02355 [Chlamydiae bacterium]|nr:hypothetical protein [Chlamydiota bacterium]